MKLRILTCLATTFLLAALAYGQGNSRYQVFNLGAPLGGRFATANAVNNAGWAAGLSNLTGDNTQHAVLWIYGFPIDLGTLGGPNSAVEWPGISNTGEVVGISDTARMDPYGEVWSCGAFLPASHAGHTCVGFKWELGRMTPLPTLGGNNGFATFANDLSQVAGWAENTVHDPTCAPPQVLQFEAVIWGPRGDVHQLPPYPGDPDGAATGINNRGQAIGISGICQNAVGNQSATHALLWENNTPINLGNLGGTAWNTPMAINEHGVIVGFSDLTGDQGGANPNFHAFRWTRPGPMQDLGTLAGDAISEALGVNSQQQIVGVSYASGFANPRAFIYEGRRMIDLNSLTVPNSPLYLQVGGYINDAGVIAGQGCVPGACAPTDPSYAFIAVPTGDGRYDVSINAAANGSLAQALQRSLTAAAMENGEK